MSLDLHEIHTVSGAMCLLEATYHKQFVFKTCHAVAAAKKFGRSHASTVVQGTVVKAI